MFILTQPARNVLYLMYMNKEVIYLEPEDDITDVLTKLQRAEQKLVALVPPKKATILRSAVNMKLIARTAKDCEKVAVIVTGDPAVIKLAMAARIPVAKTLQSRPMVPTPEMLQESKSSEQVIDEDLAEKSGDQFVTSERILQALAATSGTKAYDILRNSGVNYGRLEQAIAIHEIAIRNKIFFMLLRYFVSSLTASG